MKKVPISMVVDDPAPIVSVYYPLLQYLNKTETPLTEDGRPHVEYIPTSFLNDFCDVVEKWGLKGKFSIVPNPANRGSILEGVKGVDFNEVKEWLEIAKKRLTPYYTICPEMMTHFLAIDLKTGKDLDITESEWSQTQDRTTLKPYIKRSLEILLEAGFDVCGVTTPGSFGWSSEDEVIASVSEAVYELTGSKNSWVFIRNLSETPAPKPWVAYDENGRTVVSFPPTTNDTTWRTMDSADTSDEYISMIADWTITKDGKGGQIIDVLESGGYPILSTHWQGLYSNGLYTGLRALDEIARRINEHLSDRVEWKSAKEIMEMVVADKENYPKVNYDDLIIKTIKDPRYSGKSGFSIEKLLQNPHLTWRKDFDAQVIYDRLAKEK